MLESTGLTSAEDIRGWMPIQQVAEGFDIPLPVLYEITGIPTDIAPETPLKELEGLIPGFEMLAVREKIAEYLSSDVDPSPGSIEPAPVIVLTAIPTATPMPEPTSNPTVVVSTPLHIPQEQNLEAGSGTGPTPLPPGTILPGSEIKGRHTLSEIGTQCQVSLPELLAALGLPAGTDPSTQVKDLISQGKINDIQSIRDAVTSLQHK
jgi:hypothetical protein